MGTFFVYILKSSVCLTLFYLLYRISLSKETFHRFNRIVLLSILVLSFLIPLVEVTVPEASEVSRSLLSLKDTMQTLEIKRFDILTETPKRFPWNALMFLIYAAGIFFFLLRYGWSLGRMFCLIRTCRKEEMESGIVLYVHRKEIAPFSWMKMMVISEEDLAKNGKAILVHERAHIRNGHSWDLLLMQVCILLQWFNPAVWLLKQELQTVHEYEADKWVVGQGIDAKSYQLSIIESVVGTRLFSIANNFNHTLLNKRIRMMNKASSNRWTRLKCLFFLPLAAMAVVAFARPPIDELRYSFLNEKGLLTTVEMKREGYFTSSMKDSVLVVVDEQVKGYGEDVLNSISEKQIKSILTVHDDDAVAEYGNQAKHGAIKITTTGKNDELKSVMDEFRSKGRFNATKLASGKSLGSTPLIVIDGDVKGNIPEILSNIACSDVESITVLKQQDIAFRLYGDKAKDGVILITMKK